MKVHLSVLSFNEISVRHSLDRQSIGVLKKFKGLKGLKDKTDTAYMAYILC